ncbi:hypothetical protein VPHD479_0241 [Vibrio phage D479]
MKNVLIASALAFAATSAVAAPVTSDDFTVSGEFAVGGYVDSNAEDQSRDFYNGGVTGADIGIAFEHGMFVGYGEVDVNVEDNFTAKNVGDTVDLDKLWVGVKLGKAGVLSYGVENDTALDKIDGAGDMTVEFGYSAADADDAFNVIKFEGQHHVLAYGASVSDTGPDADRVGTFNTYVGLVGDSSAVYAGYEIREHDTTVYTITGNTKLGFVDLGANVFTQELEGKGFDEGYFVSAGVPISALYVSTGYAYTTDQESVANLGASYAFNQHFEVMVDSKYNFETEDAAGFVKGAYSF